MQVDFISESNIKHTTVTLENPAEFNQVNFLNFVNSHSFQSNNETQTIPKYYLWAVYTDNHNQVSNLKEIKRQI